MAQGKFIIIDGNSLVYRAFYALPLLATKKGIYTNAVYGFTNMLLKVLNEESPACTAIAFDKGKVTFRTEQFQEYKAHRKAMPDELRPQFPLVKEIIAAMNIPLYELEGYEADDIIGAISLKAEEQGYDTLIVTGDRDALQLVSPRTKVLLTKKGISEIELYDEDKVLERYGLTPLQVIDIKGLMGDSSDNIPGVPGVGEKTAVKLIREYGSVEELLDKRGQLKGKLRERIEEHAEQALLSKQLATIVRDVPMELDLRECVMEEPDYKRLLEIGENLEFKALTKTAREKLGEKQGSLWEDNSIDQGKECGGQDDCIKGNYIRLNPEDAQEYLINQSRQTEVLAMEFELTSQDPLKADIKGVACSFTNGEAAYLEWPEGREAVKAVMEQVKAGNKKLICHDAKKSKVVLKRKGFELDEVSFDTMVAAYLLDPMGQNKDLAELSNKYLGLELNPAEGFTAICARADLIYRLYSVLQEELVNSDMLELYYHMELPLLPVLAQMEHWGVALDTDYLRKMAGELAERIETLTRQIYTISGEEFNINSTKQLGAILFDKLGLPVVKKTKTGYSTDVEVLENLAEKHDIVAMILQYRQLVKLKSTYVDGLMAIVSPETGKVHTTFNQTVTATGRLSSTEPNLQNIPIRLEEGRRIRKAFIASEEGWQILTADYSQIELRILAHLSGDEKFVRAFRNNEDIHARTAAEVFGAPIEEVTRAMRGQAKAVNFGIVYGISDFGLAKNIAVSRKEAKQYIDNYFARYEGVKSYLDKSVLEAKEKGYVTTLLKRRRYLPDLFSPNAIVRKFGERTAMNTPIQGSAADIIKLAMVRVAECLRDKALKTRMLLQVHDELIFEVPPDEMETVIPLVRECMEKAVALEVPLTVDMKRGFNWYDMEKINN